MILSLYVLFHLAYHQVFVRCLFLFLISSLVFPTAPGCCPAFLAVPGCRSRFLLLRAAAQPFLLIQAAVSYSSGLLPSLFLT